jgi:hypothetical protein
VSCENNTIKNEIEETKRKIDWGDEMRGQLKKKLIKMKKDAPMQNLTSSSVLDELNGEVGPKPDSSEKKDVEFLNESIINSMLESEGFSHELEAKRSCTCSIM